MVKLKFLKYKFDLDSRVEFSHWSLCSDYLSGVARSVSSTCPDDEPH